MKIIIFDQNINFFYGYSAPNSIQFHQVGDIPHHTIVPELKLKHKGNIEV